MHHLTVQNQNSVTLYSETTAIATATSATLWFKRAEHSALNNATSNSGISN